MSVDVSVLTPVLNEERHIRAAVETMRAQRFAGELEFIFADGRSSDRTRAILEELAREDPRIRIVDNPARQTAAALNVALLAARGSLVARMDAHTLYPSDYLALGVERVQRGDGVVWASGPAIPFGVDPVSKAVALALHSRVGTGGSSFRHQTEEETEALTGFTGVIDRAFLERLGGWDEGWPVNQDSELGARVAAAHGRMVVLPGMAAQYIPRSSMLALMRQYRRYGFYRAKTSRAHPHSMRVAHIVPPAILLMLALAAVGPRGLQTPARVGAAAYGGALLAATGVAARSAGPAATLRLPAIFAAMHLAWGAGFLGGCVRFGPPLGALRRLTDRPNRPGA